MICYLILPSTKQQKRYLYRENLMPPFRWYGMLLPTRKYWTNGSHPNPGYPKQNIWISKWVDGDFMLWLDPKDKSDGQFKNILPLRPKPILRCIMLLQTKMKILNCRVLNGSIISANKTA